MTFNEWENYGQYISINGHQIFVIEKSSNKETLVILHGYPTCSYDFIHTLPILKKHFRIVIHDHIGFGLSDKPEDYSYLLSEQADIALSLWQHLNISSCHLLAHDYGTSVATEIIARWNEGQRPVDFKTITLCNGSMHIEMAKLRLIQKLLINKSLGPLIAKFSVWPIFYNNMKNIWYDKNLVNKEELKVLWQMLEHNNGRKVISKVSQYIRQRKTHWERWIGGLQMTTLPINIVWAEEDPVAVKAMAFALKKEIPNNKMKLLEKLGHYPMIEQPKLWADTVVELIKSWD